MPSSPTDATEPPLEPVLPAGLTEAATYASEREAFEHGLAVLAMGIPYWLLPYEGGYRLFVEAEWLDAVRGQLALFDRESRHWPPQPRTPPEPRAPVVVVLPLLWVLVTIAAFRAQELWPGPLERSGILDAHEVFVHRQYWRIATSLFLHADIGHLTANLVSGYFVFSAVFTVAGRLRGFALLTLASLLGNALVVSLGSGSSYRSLGASTAVFAGLGVLTGAALRRAVQHAETPKWRGLFAPVAAGLTLLGLFGAGELHTDVAAHGCGFAVGAICGLIAGTRSAAAKISKF